MLQDPTLCSSGMCPQRAGSPRGTTGLAGSDMSASSPARTCGSSPSSTSASWMPPQTTQSTGGSSVWRQWVSPSDWAIPHDNWTVPRSGSPDLLPAMGAGNTLKPACWAQRQPCGGISMCLPAGAGIAQTGLLQEGKHPGMFSAGLIAPPVNITARWAGAVGQLCVSWQPPLTDFLNFFLYEVQCCPASSAGMPCSTTLNPSGQHPANLSIQSTVSTHTPRAGAASPGVGQVHRGVMDGQGGLGLAVAPQLGPSPTEAGPGQHLGGAPGPAARGEVPHPGAQQA